MGGRGDGAVLVVTAPELTACQSRLLSTVHCMMYIILHPPPWLLQLSMCMAAPYVCSCILLVLPCRSMHPVALPSINNEHVSMYPGLQLVPLPVRGRYIWLIALSTVPRPSHARAWRCQRLPRICSKLAISLLVCRQGPVYMHTSRTTLVNTTATY